MKTLCPIHYYYYEGDKCPICEQERAQKMALRWVEKNMGVPKELFEEKKETTETMDEMLNKLKEKYNKH